MSKDLEGMRVDAIWIYLWRAFPADEPSSAKAFPADEPACAKALRLMGPLCSETEREPVSLEQSKQEREMGLREVRLRKVAKGLSQGHGY